VYPQRDWFPFLSSEKVNNGSSQEHQLKYLLPSARGKKWQFARTFTPHQDGQSRKQRQKCAADHYFPMVQNKVTFPYYFSFGADKNK
jgi:hypothetical protein